MADAWWLKEYADEMRWHGDDLSNKINWYAQQLYNQQNPQAQELAKTLFGNVNNLSGMSSDMIKQMQGYLGTDNPLSKIGQDLADAGLYQRDTGRGVYRDANQKGDQYYNDAVTMGNQLYGEGIRFGQDIQREARDTGNQLFGFYTGEGNQMYGDTLSMGQSLYDQNSALGQDAYKQGLTLGNQGLAMMQGLADKALNGQGAPTAEGMPDLNASISYGTTKAGQYADQMMQDYNSTFRPAAQKAVRDAMDFNSSAYREGLAQQTAGTYARQAANANQQMERDLAARGVNPNSGAAMKMRNQNALANAAGRANAITAGNMAAQERGRTGRLEAMSSKAGSHLLDAANAALGTEASVTNANTSAAANLASSKMASRTSAYNALLAAQNQYRDTSLSTAYNALNSGLTNQSGFFGKGADTLASLQGIGTTAQSGLIKDANANKASYDTNAGKAKMDALGIGSAAMQNFYDKAGTNKINALNNGMDSATTLFGTGADAMMKGGDQWLTALAGQGALQDAAGKLGLDMGKLGIDAAAGANNSALTGMQIGAYPTNQLIQNLLAGFGPRQWGMESVFNAENIHKGLSAADDGRHGALLGQIIGAVGSMFGGPLGGTIGSAIGGGLGGGGGGAYSYQGTRW